MPGGESTPTQPDPDARPVPAAVARLRPESRSTRPGILEGFVPLELADRGPRILQPTSLTKPAHRDPASPPDAAPVSPPPVSEPAEAWADRDSLFGDL